MMATLADAVKCMRLCSNHHRLLCLTRDIHMQRRFFSQAIIFCQKPRLEKTLKQAGDDFRTYEIPGLKAKSQTKRIQRKKRLIPPPRFTQMATDQDWTNVWPAASTFKWSVIPFPVRQGFVETITENDGVIPSKYANAELMKIPNFLHLTPAHVRKHCAVLKEFCTEWPKGLDTDELCQKHFPIEVETSDYCFSSSSIRDPRARVVTVKLQLSDLHLDYHARDKIIRLVGDRYRPETDELIFTSDRCPMKKQNYDYILYLLTAVYHESWKCEPWEKEKTEEDMEKYFWDISKSKKNIISLLQTISNIDKKSKVPDGKKLQNLPENMSEENLLAHRDVLEYRNAVSDMLNNKESHEAVQRYGNSVRKLLNIQGNLK